MSKLPSLSVQRKLLFQVEQLLQGDDPARARIHVPVDDLLAVLLRDPYWKKFNKNGLNAHTLCCMLRELEIFPEKKLLDSGLRKSVICTAEVEASAQLERSFLAKEKKVEAGQ